MDLQKGPLGLLGAFALKVTGRNPNQFGGVVTPVVDVYDQYLAQSELGISAATVATGLNAFVASTFTVPASKAWRVFGASIQVSLDAADVAIAASPRFQVRSPDITKALIVPVLQPPTVNTDRNCGFYTNPPLFLPSGWSLVLRYQFSAALTVTENAQFAVLRQEIDV